MSSHQQFVLLKERERNKLTARTKGTRTERTGKQRKKRPRGGKTEGDNLMRKGSKHAGTVEAEGGTRGGKVEEDRVTTITHPTQGEKTVKQEPGIRITQG